MLTVETIEVAGWKGAVEGMRNPLNSWSKSDSKSFLDTDMVLKYDLGENDLGLMQKLAVAGEEHRKFDRMLCVWARIVAPLYWWKEFDTYKVGTVRNSCSTMHKIAAKPFELDDFSHEMTCSDESDRLLQHIVDDLNSWRDLYLKTKDKAYWWNLIQLLPSSYNQRAVVMLNYETLFKIVNQRKGHKLNEWKTFIDWVMTLPYFEDIFCGPSKFAMF